MISLNKIIETKIKDNDDLFCIKGCYKSARKR